jgi:hypothetical protein
LCPSEMTESARSTPSVSARVPGLRRANSPELSERGQRPDALLRHRIAPPTDRSLGIRTQHPLMADALQIAPRRDRRILEHGVELFAIGKRISHARSSQACADEPLTVASRSPSQQKSRLRAWPRDPAAVTVVRRRPRVESRPWGSSSLDWSIACSVVDSSTSRPRPGRPSDRRSDRGRARSRGRQRHPDRIDGRLVRLGALLHDRRREPR